MRGDKRIALKALIGASAGLLLASCETLPPDTPSAQGAFQGQTQAPPIAPASVATVPAPPPPPIAP
ncbi:MAG: hypothetical protein JWO83_4523, partial [Caulobacteraceae bacterium]|nr:hypothetical protein [Caulobacteraceae bacterium]